jgi:hypothetical protein
VDAKLSPLMREAMADSRTRQSLVEAVRRGGKRGAPTYTVEIGGEVYVVTSRRRQKEVV